MTLKETTDTMIRWAESSVNDDQLRLLDSLIDRFLINRFRGDPGLANEVSRVLVALQVKSRNMITAPLPELNMN